MYRFLLGPRWVALALLATVVAVVFLALGRWQYDSAHQVAAGVRLPTAADARPLAALLPPGVPLAATAVGGAATVTGSFDPASQRLLPGQQLAGRSTDWVLTLLRPADGSPAVLVVRGWVPAGSAAPRPPAGQVRVLGWLGTAQAPGEPALAPGIPAGTLPAVSPAVLANEVSYPVRDGFLGETGTGSAAGLQALPPPAGGVDWDWQNLGYAVQWGCFAVAVFVALGFGARREARTLAAGRAGALGRREITL